MERLTLAPPVRRDEALRVARRWCADTGIDAGNLELVSLRANAVFRLPAERIGVRVYGPEDAWCKARLMLSFTRFLAERAFPAVRPSPLQAAEPEDVLDHPVSTWQWLDEVPQNENKFRALGGLIHRLHRNAATFDGPMPTFEPLAKIERRLARLKDCGQLSVQSVTTLSGALIDVSERWANMAVGVQPGHGVVHGDALPGNAVSTANGLVLIDFDSVTVAPHSWDLAPVRVVARRYGEVRAWEDFLAGYGVAPDALGDIDTMALAKELSITVALCLNAGSSDAVDDEIARRIDGWARRDETMQWRHPGRRPR